MKLVGITGTGRGKLGSSVFSVNSGQQIVRQYQPVVANPNTVAQVNQRARMKLASQLAAAYATVIAMPKQGLVSTRNQFIKKNMDAISAQGGTAQVTYENLQLTNGNVGLPSVLATRSAAEGIKVNLSESAANAVSRVVYVIFKKTTENQLQLVGSKVIEEAGDAGTFPATFPYDASDIAIYAYGMRDLNSSATAKYRNYEVNSGTDVARLFTTRNLSMSDISLTQTRGNTMFAGSNETTQAGDGQVMVYAAAQGDGEVIILNGDDELGQGASVRVAVAVGTTLTLRAGANGDAVFAGWYTNEGNSSQRLTLQEDYEVTVNDTIDVVARFNSGLPGDLGNG